MRRVFLERLAKEVGKWEEAQRKCTHSCLPLRSVTRGYAAQRLHIICRTISGPLCTESGNQPRGRASDLSNSGGVGGSRLL